MRKRWAAGVAAGAAALLSGEPARAQGQAPRDEVRAALAAQIWGEGPGVALEAAPAGGVRLLYQSPRGTAEAAYLPAERRLQVLTPAAGQPAAPRKRAKLGYALTDRLELFVDLQKRQPDQTEAALAQDWLPPETRRPRTYAVGITTRW
ncbi:hypothetical protein ACO2Q0_08985 [Phenylobacterium sp. VNQ135]|uniref:hypothetical protein n=1 Tax=Phenylobacterium sp. VNQ135 TaxID=3400922 RepID=UPI003C0483A1